MGGFFIAMGVLLFVVTLGLAFTIYGIVAAILGTTSFLAGVWMLARRPHSGAPGQ